MDAKQYAFFKIDDAELIKNNKVKCHLYNCTTIDKRLRSLLLDPRPNNSTQTLYSVMNYDKTVMCFDEPLKTRQCRSVILSFPDNKLLSFSPPKSNVLSEFQKKFPEIQEDIYINEQIEGTLLHLFYDPRIDSWEIATKKAVGGRYSTFYYKNPKMKKTTVRNMFLDALAIPHETNFKDIKQLNSLSKDYSYCFILQHPENHIVFSIDRPQLYLIAVYDILPVSRRIISIPPLMYEEWECFNNLSMIQFPKKIELNTYSEILNYYEHKNDYTSKGIIVTNLHNGEHFTVKNPIYEQITNNPGLKMNSLQYQYLCFYKIGKVSEFFAHYPKYRKYCDAFFKQIQSLTKDIHEFYMEKYVFKYNVSYLNVDKLEYIADVLHKIHLQSLSKYSVGVVKITKTFISQYLMKKDPDELFYIMNYDLRRITNKASCFDYASSSEVEV
jgi:hypothetical protein